MRRAPGWRHGSRERSARRHRGVDRRSARVARQGDRVRARAHRRPTRRSGRAPVNGCVRRGRARDARASLLDVAERLLAPGASRPRPGMASRHVIDDAFDPRDLSVLVAAAKTSMNALRARSGEASAAALGRASEGILGLDAHVAMRRTIRAMTETARRAVHGVPSRRPRRKDRTEEGAHSEDDDAPTLRPAGALFTHIVPGETSVTSVSTQSTPIDAHGYWSPHVDKANVGVRRQRGAVPVRRRRRRLRGGRSVELHGRERRVEDGDAAAEQARRVQLGEENVHAVGLVTPGADDAQPMADPGPEGRRA